MKRINLVVEGQSEETFVRDVLAPSLAPQGLAIVARCVETGKKRVGIAKGGMTNYLKAKNDISQWLKQDRKAYVSTMFDLYALPNDFPGFTTVNVVGHGKATVIEAALSADINDRNFVPYIQVHEFEALAFSDIQQIDDVIPDCRAGRTLHNIRLQYQTPEHINDGPTTAPSKRILSHVTSYRKVLHGARVTKRIGLPKILEECPHFKEWIEQLLSLPQL
jgi:hypothetical protein